MPVVLGVLLFGSPEPVVTVGGLPIPDAGPVFVVVLAVHVLAGAVCVVSGALAATAPKRPGRHRSAGTAYVCGLLVLVGSAGELAVLRWAQDRRLFAIAVVTAAAGFAGWTASRRRSRRWLLWHGACMAGSYIALLTGFYVDNGPHLPLWDRLPPISYWLLPAVVGFPLTWWALRRHGGPARSVRSAGASQSSASPGGRRGSDQA